MTTKYVVTKNGLYRAKRWIGWVLDLEDAGTWSEESLQDIQRWAQDEGAKVHVLMQTVSLGPEVKP